MILAWVLNGWQMALVVFMANWVLNYLVLPNND